MKIIDPDNMRQLSLPTIFFLLLHAGIGHSQSVHHRLHVNLMVHKQMVEVIDTITLPSAIDGKPLAADFSLNRNFAPEIMNPGIILKKFPEMGDGPVFSNYKAGFDGMEAAERMLVIRYSGIINEAVTTGADEYARGFSTTTGIISDSGAYLAGSTWWVPAFGDALVTYDMTVTLPAEWNVVSQGERMVNKEIGPLREVRYHSPHPAEEIYLVAGPWTEYEKMAGDVRVQAFMRSPDGILAMRYIDATAGYLEMYEEMIGPYPYSKFALVENFWETGFGMPSFTLLGQKVIRFPWILTTSYPHELLHNWWGNSVYVDFDEGNWCEGLTAYMADHLLKEQKGEGAAYRRETLQKFTDYVNPGNDFPLTWFRSRNNPAEEAIGYGKCLMFNHMLRMEVGDEVYLNAYRRFYKDNMFRVAAFDDILAAFSEEQEVDLVPFFEQWLLRKGAPQLELAAVSVVQEGGDHHLHFDLLQVQEEAPFYIEVPVAVYFEDRVETLYVISAARNAGYSFRFQQRPVRIEVDPAFDVFRRLDRAEVPPTLSRVFGSEEAMIILPEKSPFLEDYKGMAATWKATQEAQGKALHVVVDEELDSLPAGATAWILGFENRFAGLLDVRTRYAGAFDAAQQEMVGMLEGAGSLVYAVPNPGDKVQTVGFVGTNVREAIPGLTRLLTHYGKYSFLGFEGERPNNVLKGNFPAIDSPMFRDIPFNGTVTRSAAALAPPPPLFR